MTLDLSNSLAVPVFFLRNYSTRANGVVDTIHLYCIQHAFVRIHSLLELLFRRELLFRALVLGSYQSRISVSNFSLAFQSRILSSNPQRLAF